MNPIDRIRMALAAMLLATPWVAAAQDIVIGQVAPLTGVLADTGKDMVLGVRVYFDHVNESGGIGGRKIKHIVKDDGYVIDNTVKQTRELIDKDKPVALIGFAGTGNVGELLKQDVLGAAKIALIAPYTGGEPLRNPYNPWIFHIRAGYADEAEEMVKQLERQGRTRIAVMYQDDPFGKAGLAGVEAALAKRKLKLLASAGYEKGTDNVDAAAKALAAELPQAVIMISINKPSGAFIKLFRDLAPGVQLFNISVVNPKELARIAGADNARGVGIAQVMPYPYAGGSRLVEEYKKLMAKHAPDAEISYTSFEEFVGAKVLVEALRRTGGNPTRDKVIKSLESLKNYDTGGFKVSFGPNQRLGSKFVEVTLISKNGTLVR